MEHHGRVDDLILCKGSFTEANELKDEMQTLKGYGIKGAPRGVDTPVIVPLFYDFKPVAYDEPLLLVGVPYDVTEVCSLRCVVFTGLNEATSNVQLLLPITALFYSAADSYGE